MHVAGAPSHGLPSKENERQVIRPVYGGLALHEVIDVATLKNRLHEGWDGYVGIAEALCLLGRGVGVGRT